MDQLLTELGEAVEGVLAVSGIHYDDINARSSSMFVVGWNRRQWDDLPDGSAQLVGQARQTLREVEDFILQASRDAPDRAREFQALDAELRRLIEQPNGCLPNGAPAASLDQVREQLLGHVAGYRATVGRVPNAQGRGERLLVADTSALLDRPDLQDWRLDGQPWTVVLVPQVHSELDDCKRDPHTRDAAQKVINQLEDLDRRGDTFAGVRLNPTLTLREAPTSPDMKKTLSWLRADVPDDHILAAALRTCGVI